MQDNKVDILDLIIVLVRNKKLILTNVLILTVLSLVISLVWPKTYQSTSEIIQTRESIGGVSSILQSFSSINSGQSKVGGETILIILNSETLRMSLIEEFNLDEVYDSKIKEELLLKLNEALTIEDTREGGFGFNPIVSIKIGVEDKDPSRAMEMNNFILNGLSERMKIINTETTSETLALLESRKAKNDIELEAAELALNYFQNTYGILQVDTQIKSMIENIAIVKSKMLEKEIELEVVESKMSDNSQIINDLKVQFNALNGTYNKLIRESESLEPAEDVFYPLLDLPDLLIEYYRLVREVEIQQSIYEFLLPQIEQQRLYLENSNSGLRVIDRPDLPTYKFKPKRAFIVIGGFLFSIFISLIFIFYKEMIRNEDSETSVKIQQIRDEFFNAKR